MLSATSSMHLLEILSSSYNLILSLKFSLKIEGGRDQIGCGGQSELKNSTSSSVSLLWDTEAKFVPCSHVRALSLFEDDLSSEPNQCQIVGYHCANYEEFLAGKCGKCDAQNNQCRLMSIPPLFANFNKMTFRRPFPVSEKLPVPAQTGTTLAPTKDIPQMHAIQGEYNDTTHEFPTKNNKHNGNNNNQIAHSTKLVNLVDQISNGSIAWIVDDKELNQKIGSTIAKLKPELVLSEKEDKVGNKQAIYNKEDNEIKRMDRKITNDQRERLVQTIDKIKSDTKQAFSVGWLNPFKSDVDIWKHKLGSQMKPSSSYQSNQQQQHFNQINGHINHLSASLPVPPTLDNDKLSIQASLPLSQSISIKPVVIYQPKLIQAQDVQSSLEPYNVPLGGQALPAGSTNGPLYYVGTGPVSPYCVNYYQFRLLIAESRINRFLISSSLAPNRLGVANLAKDTAKLIQNEFMRNNPNLREPSSSRDKLHMTIKLSDVNGYFFKGFTLVKDARYLIRPSGESHDRKFSPGNENMFELTMLLNTTQNQPVRIGEAIISYYFHKIVLADTVEVNYMSNISPE